MSFSRPTADLSRSYAIKGPRADSSRTLPKPPKLVLQMHPAMGKDKFVARATFKRRADQLRLIAQLAEGAPAGTYEPFPDQWVDWVEGDPTPSPYEGERAFDPTFFIFMKEARACRVLDTKGPLDSGPALGEDERRAFLEEMYGDAGYKPMPRGVRMGGNGRILKRRAERRRIIEEGEE